MPTTYEKEVDDLFSLDPSDEDISMFSFPTPAGKDDAAAIGSKHSSAIATKQRGVKLSTSGSEATQGSLFSYRAGDVANELANHPEIQWRGLNPSHTRTWDFPRFNTQIPGFSHAMKQGTNRSGRGNLKK